MKNAFDVIGRWSDSLNGFALNASPPGLRRRAQQAYLGMPGEGQDTERDLDALWLYYDRVRAGWRFALFYSMLLMGAATYIGDKVGGYSAGRIGLAVGVFPAVASLVGEFDMVWRRVDLRSARKRARRGLSDETTHRRLRRARSNHGTLLVQAAAALAVAIPIAVLR